LRDLLQKRLNVLIALIFVLAVVRLWIIHLPVSFWVDEMVTVFVVQHGPNDPSLAIAPQVAKSNYYLLARAADALFGVSEIGYRLPSILVMGLTLLLVARLAARLIHPDAAWFAVFACLALKSLNTEAIDARPYGLGMCVSAAALVCLVRWLDTGGWIPALGFLLFGALLWRVHLLFWPLYLVFVLYAIVRWARRETTVSWLALVAGFVVLAIAIAPVAIDALPVLRQAHAHVIVPAPRWGEFTDALKWKLLLSTFAVAGILDRMLHWTRDQAPATWNAISGPSICLILAWWLIHPISLFAFSSLSGNSVFIPRYLSVALPGTALAAILGAALFIPRMDLGSTPWKWAALVFGAGVLLTVGNWRHPWTPHANSDWRGAARAVREVAGPDTPVLCPSPFIEAIWPVWRPDYPLPGFLYAQLSVYSPGGHPYLLPYQPTPEAESYVKGLCRETLPRSGHFVIYGNDRNVMFWRDWIEKQPELSNWRARDLGAFGDVEAVVMEPALTPR